MNVNYTHLSTSVCLKISLNKKLVLINIPDFLLVKIIQF